MNNNLKKALECILNSCGLEAVRKINDEYITFDKTKLCNHQWELDIDLPDEDNIYVKTFVELYRNSIDTCEYDGCTTGIYTIILRLALLCDVEQLVVSRFSLLSFEAARNWAPNSDKKNQLYNYNLLTPPYQMPEFRSTMTNFDHAETNEFGIK